MSNRKFYDEKYLISWNCIPDFGLNGCRSLPLIGAKFAPHGEERCIVIIQIVFIPWELRCHRSSFVWENK
jgi:hypothetical protein